MGLCSCLGSGIKGRCGSAAPVAAGTCALAVVWNFVLQMPLRLWALCTGRGFCVDAACDNARTIEVGWESEDELGERQRTPTGARSCGGGALRRR